MRISVTNLDDCLEILGQDLDQVGNKEVYTRIDYQDEKNGLERFVLVSVTAILLKPDTRSIFEYRACLGIDCPRKNEDLFAVAAGKEIDAVKQFCVDNGLKCRSGRIEF